MAKYDAINFAPPQGVRAACRRGLKLHEQGLSGDGLEPATVAWARKFAAGQACSPAKARKGNRWYGRNSRFAKQPKDSPAYVSWLLWGGRAGKGWFASLVRQMDAADKTKDSSAMEIERKFIDLASLEFDTKSEGNGDLKGYASVTGEIDEGGDVIPSGGYTGTLDEFLRSGWMAHSHDWSVAGQVGYPVEAREDETGLYVRAEFHGTPDAQAVRTKAAERMRAGKQVGLSIGYRPSVAPEYIYPDKYGTELPKYIKPARLAENLQKAQQFNKIRILPKVELREFSIVTAPMNRLSEATAIKSEGTMEPTTAPATVEAQDESTEAKGYFESALVERMTGEGLWPLQSALAEAIHEIQDDCEDGECDDPGKALRDTLQAFAERVYAMMLPLFRAIQPEAEDVGMTLAGFTNLSKLRALKSEPLAGLPFSAHSETALAAVGEIAAEVTALKDCLAAYAERGKSIQEMRVKVGRAISAARLEQMGATCGRIKTLMGDLQSIHDDLTALMDGAKPMMDGDKPMDAEKSETPEPTPEATLADLSAEAKQLYAQILKHRLTQLTAVN